MTERSDHIVWCKERALVELGTSGPAAAVASMLSDLGKHEPPVFNEETFVLLAQSALLFCKTADDVRHWIDGVG